MTQGNESPGIGGLPDLPKPKTAAPKAWQNLMRAVTVSGPRSLSVAAKARARMLRR